MSHSLVDKRHESRKPLNDLPPEKGDCEGVALFGIASREVVWLYYSEVFVTRKDKPNCFQNVF